MDIGSLLLGLALLLVIAFIVARPLLEQTGVREQPAGPADQLLASREQVLTQLRDLDFDQATGKINPEDYAAQRAQLVAEGVAILKQLDALGIEAGQPVAASAAAPATAPADEIEAAVAQMRVRRAAPQRAAAEPAAGAARRRVDARIEPSAVSTAEIEPAVAQVRARRATPQRAAAEPAAALARRDVDAEIETALMQRRSAARANPLTAKNGAADKLAAAEKLAPVEKSAVSENPLGGEKLASADELAAAGKLADAETLACVQCGTEVLPNDRFCPKCGSALTIACGNCGRVARAGDRFCAHCGQPLPTPVAAGQPVRQAKLQG